MKYSKEELMVVTGAREIKDYDKVLVGIGLPMACAILAKLTHAPHSVIFFENGVVDPKSIDYGVGLADLKAWSGASYYTGTLEVMGYMLHGGKFDVGFVGVLEVDMYGNVNSTIVEVNGKPRHFTGSGGGNDIVSLARKIIVITRHEKRKIKEKVFYVTSPGYIGGRDRREVGLRGGDIVVITDMAVLKFNKNKGRMDVVSIHPGIKIEEVINNTGFPLEIPSDVPTTPEPTEHELKVLREKVPATLYSKSL